ncbi:hypothetical protein [Rubrimonas sp.]|uniref:hypothetical protein n=1 Tax=Rubrimonas sp. TaxID=2036015 RepID=UPI002FDE62F8
MRPFAALLSLLLLLSAPPMLRAEGPQDIAAPDGGLRLVMIEREGCVWCKRWKAEIGPIYAATEEGRRAPLRIVDVTRGWPAELAAYAPERMTPSFLLLRGTEEIGRIRGYPGEDFFWGLLGQMLGPPPFPP